jgi:hypothetical protein
VTDAPEKIWANPEGEYGQGFDAVTLSTWDEVKEYSDATEYTRSDIADTLQAEVARLKAELERIEKINGLAHNYISCYDCRESSMIARAALEYKD